MTTRHCDAYISGVDIHQACLQNSLEVFNAVTVLGQQVQYGAPFPLLWGNEESVSLSDREVVATRWRHTGSSCTHIKVGDARGVMVDESLGYGAVVAPDGYHKRCSLQWGWL